MEYILLTFFWLYLAVIVFMAGGIIYSVRMIIKRKRDIKFFTVLLFACSFFLTIFILPIINFW